jgi:hypothetical protein
MARTIVSVTTGILLLCGGSLLHAEASKPNTLNPRTTTTIRGLTAEQEKQLEYERYQKEIAAQQAKKSATRPASSAGVPIDSNSDTSARVPPAAENAPAASKRPGAVVRKPTALAKPQYERVYVEDAQIVNVAPALLRPDERVVVDVAVVLGKPISPSELADQLQVLLDATPLDAYPLAAPVAPEAETAATPEAGGGLTQNTVRPMAAARPTSEASNKFTLTLFARVPANAPAGAKLSLSVFDRLDGKTIAKLPVETAVLAAPTDSASKPGEKTFWEKYGGAIIVGIFLALGLFGYVSSRHEKRQADEKIKNLQETVQSTRTVLGEVTGEAPRQGGADGPPIRKIEIPGVIHEALERGELGIIVGAGASVYANLPVGASLWLSALEKLRGAVTDDQRLQLQKLIAESGSDAAIEPLLSLVGRDRLVHALGELLAMEHASPREFHQHLCSLASLGARRFVDLSWDRVFDELLKPCHARTFSSGNFNGLSEALRNPQVTIIKPYGEIGTTEGMSLTPQEFRRQLTQAPELERCLASLFSAQNLLFVGMSTKAIEQFLSSLPAQLESSGREHFALVPFEWSLELWSQGFAKRYGITVLPVGPDGSEEGVTQVLGRIASEAQRRRAAQSTAPGKQTAFTGIGTLRSVSLRNIGNFKSIDVDFEGHWNLLLGDNGGGKSTILRSITLALSGNDPRGEAMAARLLRTGETAGSIELTLGPTGATKVRTTLVRDGSRVKITSPQVTPLQAGQGLVLGFPALRGVTSTQPTGPTRMDTPDPNVDDVAPLLQERVDTRLNQLKQWVINTALQAETAPQGREAQMLKTFRRVLRDVVPGRHVDFKGVDRHTWNVWLRTDDGEASFDALSQGTSSILGWVGVLLQRLYGIYPSAEHPEDGPALVLIDEIDAHLHPRWQRKLVTLTREQFPNVQMIASSHSPLLAGAMRRAELRIVERDRETGEMRAGIPRENLQGQTADQILTSSLFDLPTSRSPEAEQLINKYFKLFEKHDRTNAQDEELRSFEAELDQLNYGPSRLLRETQHALDQKVEEQLDSISPEMAAAISARVSGSQTKETA